MPTHSSNVAGYTPSLSPCISMFVYSLHAQFQTQIPVDIVSKIKAFSDEMSKFPIGYDAEVTSDENADKLHLQVMLSLLER